MISVLIPAYKAKYLSEAISSVLKQTYKDFELIIVNDNSPEDLTSIVNSFNDSRIKYYINKENIGSKDLVRNWNLCLSYATGEYFCLLCDDDFYEPTFLEEMLSLTYAFPTCNVFRSGVNIINKYNEIYDYYPSSPLWETSEDYMWHVFKGYRCQTITEWFYRRKPVIEQGGYRSLPLAWYSDFLSIFELSLIGGIASTSKRLVTFRMSGENITSKLDSNSRIKMDASVLFENSVINLIKENQISKKDMLLSLLRKYMNVKRKFALGTCKFNDLCYFIVHKNKYQITWKMIIKSFKFRMLINN